VLWQQVAKVGEEYKTVYWVQKEILNSHEAEANAEAKS